MSKGDTSGAVEFMESLDPEERKQGSRLITLARAYTLNGSSNAMMKGEEVLKEHIMVYPRDVVGYVSLGKLLIHMNRAEEAEVWLRAGETKADTNKDASFLTILGKAIANNPTKHGNLDAKAEALRYAVKAEESFSDDAMVQYELGMLFFFLTPTSPSTPKAIIDSIHARGKAALTRSREINSSLDRNFIGKVYAHYKHFDWAAVEFQAAADEAMTEAKRTARQRALGGATPSASFSLEPVVEALTLLAECRELLNQPIEAEKTYKQVLHFDPHNTRALLSLGKLLMGLGLHNYAALQACAVRRSEAIPLLERARSLLEIKKKNLQHQSDPVVAEVLKAVQETLAFCDEESREVHTWAQAANVLRMRAQAQAQAQAETASIEHAMMKRISTGGSSRVLTVSRGLLASLSVWLRHLTRFIKAVVGLGAPTPSSSQGQERRNQSTNNKHGNNENKESETLSIKVQRTRARWGERAATLPAVRRTTVQSPGELLGLIKAGKPAIITNMQDHWQWGQDGASSSSSSSTLRETLLNEYGDELVRVSISPSDRFDGPETGDKWGLSASTEVLVRPPSTTMCLRDYFTLTANGNGNGSGNGSDSGSSSTGGHGGEEQGLRETFYIEYLSLQQYLGATFTDRVLPLPPQLAPLLSTRENDLPPLQFLVSNLWMAHQSTTVSPLHYDDYENLLFQLEGEKEFVLFPPEEFPNLYYTGRPKGKMSYTYPGNFTRDTQTLDKRSFMFAGSVNLDKPNYHKHPLYAKTKPLRAHLQPGEVLFVPAYWHHEVQSIPSDGGSGMNVAMNVWCANLTFPHVPGMH